MFIPAVLGVFVIGGAHSGASPLEFLIAMSLSEGLMVTLTVAGLMGLAAWARPRDGGRA